EDGIRYLIVTGVQTCALPIYNPAEELKAHRRLECKVNNSDKKKRGYEFFPSRVECAAFPKPRNQNGYAHQAQGEQNQVTADFKAHRLPGSELHSHRAPRQQRDEDADYTQRDNV